MHTQQRQRDPRLDFFRGIGMFIIFTAHVPGNWWTLWIPARFGFSDATEIFVFCSGMASAIAFGRVFGDRGWLLGTARIGFRMWQVYWCHVGLFLAVAASMVVLNRLTTIEGYDYVAYLNLTPFFNDAGTLLPALLTLRYVPNYFDILPMYLVLLALIPVVMALHRVAGVAAAAAFILALWLATQFGLTGLTAEPWSDRTWFFNPFGWSLVFFSGFGLGAGWVRAPVLRPWMIWIAVAFVIVSVPFAYYRILDAAPWLAEFRERYLGELVWKSEFGLLRYLHFMALAVLAVAAVGARGHRLQGGGVWGQVVRLTRTVGQQSLAVFIFSMFAARLVGAALDHAGSSYVTMTVANLSGWAMLTGVAYGVGWLKRGPWRGPVPALPQELERS